MKKTFISMTAVLIAGIVSSTAYSSSINGNSTLASSCSGDTLIPLNDGQHTNMQDEQNLPIYIHADHFKANYPTLGIYTGNVKIQQGQRTILADNAQIAQKQTSNNPPERILTLKGDVQYEDNSVALTAPRAVANLTHNEFYIFKPTYKLVGQQGHGTAKTATIRNNRYTVIKDGNFTTCLPNSNSWSIHGSTIIQDKTAQTISVWNAIIKVGKIPVFYTPYLEFPTSSTRRSGLLRPSFSRSSSGGFQFAQPIYWNIAPNLDATITPQWFSKRGIKLNSEVRYLFSMGSGQFAFEWMPDDHAYHPLGSNKKDRWLFHWSNQTNLTHNWQLNVDYTRISDPTYFSDFVSQYGSNTEGYANQQYGLSYSDKHWNSSLNIKRFQLFGQTTNSDLYYAEPEWNIDYYRNFGRFRFHTFAQIANFRSANVNNPSTIRLHLQPDISLPLNYAWGGVTTTARLFLTHYQQDIPKTYQGNLPLKRNVNRVIPQFVIDGHLVFEKQSQLFKGYQQTLEPRIQYVYTGYSDQQDINIYDSTLLQNDYSGLFRTRTYSGLDRISSNNQIAAGVTTRFYNSQHQQKFNFSIGQIYYFTPPRTTDIDHHSKQPNYAGNFSWAANSYYKINQYLKMNAGIQYDANFKDVANANVALGYQRDQQRILQLNYRYASKNYILSTLNNTPYLQNNISQLGIVASWPITPSLSAIGSYYYSLDSHQSVDSFIGFQYQTPCWGIQLVYGRKIIGLQADNQQSRYDNKFSFSFQFRGFNHDNDINTYQMLENTGNIPYRPLY